LSADQSVTKYDENGIITREYYEQELERLQAELIKLQSWVEEQNLRVIALFEGRDAAGKTEMIQNFTRPLNPRMARTVALGKPAPAPGQGRDGLLQP
jgi:polyphosphate kinase 2 (PPK2 family)